MHRIMHWGRRIEQEIDRVFQHITGAQQLKGTEDQGLAAQCLRCSTLTCITVIAKQPSSNPNDRQPSGSIASC
ncbi:unnamed protein product [Arctogadus glacialis]